MNQLPTELFNAIRDWCINNNYGFGMIVGEHHMTLLIGDIHPNETAILSARSLLDGVIEGKWTELNEEMKRNERKRVN